MSKNTLSRAGQLYWGRATSPKSDRPGALVVLPSFERLGAIATAAANAISLSQSVNSGVAALLNGAVGAAAIPTPRNIVAAWTNTAIVTVTGKDVHGYVLVESSASGTSFTGKKAFAIVTSVTFNANVTGATVGTGVVIGLSYRCDKADFITARVDNTVDAATVVPADTTVPATATTGDVRGTVTFASAPDATKVYSVTYVVKDPETKEGTFGFPQFAG
jgi:hypothetical protein